ncbi:MAG: sulfur carrier protein ThiS adenylyltransferase ThiF [Bacteroidales bacterium]
MTNLSFEKIKAKLADKIVGIAGAGGLGSNCAVALARVGIGKLVIADFDVVSEGNLNRQYFFTDQVGRKKVSALKENIARINPAVQVTTHDVVLDPVNIPRLFDDCNVIVEAFDLAEMKKMIAEAVIEKMPAKYLVMGSGVAGFGNNNTIKTIKTGNIYICGDLEKETGKNRPPLAPRVGIVANMQANQVLELLLTRP